MGGAAKPALLQRVVALTNQAVADPEAALRGVLQLLIEAARAQNGYVILATRRGAAARRRKDPVGGFRIDSYHRAIPLSPRASLLLTEIVRDRSYVDSPDVQVHTLRRNELWLERRSSLDLSASQVPALRALDTAIGAGDVLMGGVPLGPGAHFRIGIERALGERRFRDTDRTRVLELLPVLDTALRRIGAWSGVFDGRVLLSPRESEMFRLLLGRKSEKQIAGVMSLTARSAHQVVLSVYAKLAVSSRVELFHRWLELAS